MLWVHQKQQEYPRRVTNISFFLVFFCYVSSEKGMFHGGANTAFGLSSILHDFMKVQQQPAAKKRSARCERILCYSRMHVHKEYGETFLWTREYCEPAFEFRFLWKVLHVQVVFYWLAWKKATHLNGWSFWDFTLSTWRRDACVALCTRALRVCRFMESSRSLGLTEMMEFIES